MSTEKGLTETAMAEAAHLLTAFGKKVAKKIVDLATPEYLKNLAEELLQEAAKHALCETLGIERDSFHRNEWKIIERGEKPLYTAFDKAAKALAPEFVYEVVKKASEDVSKIRVTRTYINEAKRLFRVALDHALTTQLEEWAEQEAGKKAAELVRELTTKETQFSRQRTIGLTKE